MHDLSTSVVVVAGPGGAEVRVGGRAEPVYVPPGRHAVVTFGTAVNVIPPPLNKDDQEMVRCALSTGKTISDVLAEAEHLERLFEEARAVERARTMTGDE